MLVLSRYENERIIIGEGANQVTISIIQIRGPMASPKVRIGIEAPPGVAVDREEVRLSKLADKEQQP